MKTLHDADFLKFVGKQESQFLTKPSELTGDVLDRLNGKQTMAGEVLPWIKTHTHVALRPGELSIWAGVNGHGKSNLLGQVCAWSLRFGVWVIASLEMKPAATMQRMVRQVAGCKNPEENYTRWFLEWTDNRLWIYDQTDTVSAERILGMVHYCAEVLKVNHIVIDSLMKCGLGTDDYNAQKTFVDRLCWAAKSTNIHVHLVHHMRKGNREGDMPDKFDVRGASEITDLADNVFIVHRNKRKEEMQQQGKDVDAEEPDCMLKVAKQRNGEWEGMFRLWFHRESLQYTGTSDTRVIPWEVVAGDTTDRTRISATAARDAGGVRQGGDGGL